MGGKNPLKYQAARSLDSSKTLRIYQMNSRSSESHIRPRRDIIRLVGAVLAAASTVGFVLAYSRMSSAIFEFTHSKGQLTPFNQFLVFHAQLGFAFPVFFLLGGSLVLRFRPSYAAVFESILQAAWLFTIIAFGLCLLSWQIQNVPVMSGGQWHF